MRIAAQVAAAYLALVLVGAIWHLLPFEILAPNLPAIFAAYLGITRRDPVPRSVMGAVVIGYLADLLMGTPRGLIALTAGLLCIMGRLVSARLLVRGWVFISVFSFIVSLVASVLNVAIRVYLDAGLGTLWRETTIAIGSAFLTALVAPLLFKLCRKVDVAFARTERDREATREGYLL